MGKYSKKPHEPISGIPIGTAIRGRLETLRGKIEAACFSPEPVKNMDFSSLIKKWLEVAHRPVGTA